jgi:hypothetical protein
MTKISKYVVAALVLGALAAGLSGCQKKEGPAERAGKEIDQSMEKTGGQIDKSLDKAGDKMERAGDHMKDAVDDLKK